jgi:hypothetical protein
VYAQKYLPPFVCVHTTNQMEIAYDPAKDAANIAKHGASSACARPISER